MLGRSKVSRPSSVPPGEMLNGVRAVEGRVLLKSSPEEPANTRAPHST